MAVRAGTARTNSRALVGPLEVDVLTFDQALARIAVPAARPARTVTTANIQQVALALGDPQFARLVNASAITVADGWPVARVAGAIAGRPCQRVAGSALLPALLTEAGRAGLSVAIVGGRPGAAEDVVGAHLESWPGSRAIALSTAIPHAPDAETLALLAPILDAEPFDLVILALGSPKSDRLGRLIAAELDSGTVLGVGAGVDFLAGKVRRAPLWLQRIGLEWAWRLCLEPRRLSGRYARSAAAFAPVALSAIWRRR
ncbi:MAG: hypothetical protein RLZ55_886 [Actinomycetota bacterium]|jgi:N-acetylglucosaminyldiphosphoundecaprenol N-acetyl-beta-D-mannosaminyltransferase